MLNIIADVAGRWHELQALKKKMPPGKFLYVGDLNDRGRWSKQVIEHVMNDPDSECLRSNHGQMFTACYNEANPTQRILPVGYYPPDNLRHPRNGCLETVRSYGGWNHIPREHALWMNSRPWFYTTTGLFVSHAPWAARARLRNVCDLELESSLIWNRNYDFYTGQPLPLHERRRFQIYGHNGYYKEHRNAEGKLYGLCIDDCKNKKLVGVQWPTLVKYEQEYLTYD